VANIRDKVNATHVAITVDGIKFVVDAHKTSYRLDCQDVGRVSKTVAYKQITDADIAEPGGKSGPWCCMIDNVLTVVNLDTASRYCLFILFRLQLSFNPIYPTLQLSLKSIYPSLLHSTRSTPPFHTTISGGGVQQPHELSITGLSDPHAFKQDVWAMIRGEGVNGKGNPTLYSTHPPPHTPHPYLGEIHHLQTDILILTYLHTRCYCGHWARHGHGPWGG
jgi:hypothetical protein